MHSTLKLLASCMVLYRRVDLDAWLESHFVGGED